MSTDDDARRERLGDAAAPGNTQTYGNAYGQGYSTLIRSLRIILPVTALGLALLILTWPREEPTIPRVEEVIPMHQAGDANNSELLRQQAQNELINPTFDSLTRDGQPYRVTATRAQQNPQQPDLIYLEDPRAEVTLSGGPAKLSADDGTYHQEQEFITLSGDIVISGVNGEELFLKVLEADLKDMSAVSALPVRGTGPQGTIAGQSLRIRDGGDVLILGGPATLTLTRMELGL